MADADDAPDAYETLLDQYRRVFNLESAGGLLNWDQQVMMPEGGQPARSQQVSTLSTVAHETLTDDAVGAALDDLSEAALSPPRAANVREVRRQYRRADRVPEDLVAELSAASSDALPVWQEAKSESDFDTFAPVLEDLVDLSREYAEHIDPDRDPYEVLFEEYEPYLGLDTAEQVLTTLREELVPLVDAVAESDVTLPTIFEGTFDTDTQEALARDALDTLGYDWNRGRLDTAPHPFSMGTVYDARVTTRYEEEDPLSALLSTVHEFGHATYTQGLPEERYGQPLGEPRDLSVHESQSRFWENHVARSEAFWERFLPRVEEHFPSVDATPAEAYAAANRVYDDNPIRVEADELTYHMHIVLRFEIERDLIRGDLDVSEVPGVWREKSEQYLGITPENDAVGALQDIHWSHASFGYFPTYSLGSVLAAQLAAEMGEDLALDERVRDGDFDPLREWLRDRIHDHGKRYTTPTLIERVTGSPLSADAFVDYATEKYGTLYDL